MSRVLFGDTSGFYAGFVQSDARHQQAVSVLGTQTTILTTRLIMIETVSLINKRISPFHAKTWFDMVTQNEAVLVEEFNEVLFQEAIKFWKKNKDKAWDLIDCYSFCFMRKKKIQSAWTFDRHFAQAGFQSLSDL